MGKRVIEETASNEIFNDDWFLKDSPTQGTTKLSGSDLKSIMNIGQAESADLADAYDPNHNYVEGDVCIHDDTLHKANDDTTGPWDSTKWDAVTVAELIEEGGKVKDVKVNGTSVVDENKNANVTVPVLDVTVNGGSVVDNNKNAVLDSLVAYGEANGEIATFSDGSDLAMKSLKVAIEPQQDLHGYDAPWVGGAGKNKYSILIGADEWNGNADGSATDDNGTLVVTCTAGNNSGAYSKLSANIYDLIGQYSSDVTYSFDIKSNSNGNILIGYTDVGRKEINVTTSWQRVNISATAIGSNKAFVIYNKSGSAMEIQVKNFMFEIGSVAHPYEPYSNICPISGWDEVNVTRCGKNLWANGNLENETRVSINNITLFPNTYTISAVVTSTDTDANTSGVIFEYADGTNSSIGQLSRNTRSSCTIVTTKKVAKIAFYASDNYGHSASDIFSISDIQIEIGSQPSSYHAYNGHTYTIDLDGTRYGGTLDVVSGVLTVDRVTKDLGDLSYNYTNNIFVASLGINYKYINDTPSKNSCYQYNGTIASGTSDMQNKADGTYALYYNANYSDVRNIYIKDSRYTDATTYKTAMTGQKVLFELATPQNIQLTPTQVKSLLGVNNVWADCGDVDVSYVRDLTTTINYILEQLNS